MPVTLLISLRNLVRQKRRNILLGTAIAFGVMILVVAHSFSRGISDIMFNRVIKWAAGHVSVNFAERGNVMKKVFRDRARIMGVIESRVFDALEINENTGFFGRVIGRHKADNMVLVGIDMGKAVSEETRKEVEDQYRMVIGKWEDISSPAVENAVIMSDEKAAYLKVKKGDTLSLRVKNIYGQDQALRATVVGVFRNTNIFMNVVTFMELKNVKRIMGYTSDETADITFTLRDPQRHAVALAQTLHAALKPEVAVIRGEAAVRGSSWAATVLGFKTDEASKALLEAHVNVSGGDPAKVFSKEGVYVSSATAHRRRVKLGDTLEFTYRNKYQTGTTTIRHPVTGWFEATPSVTEETILLSEQKFYDTYYYHLPESAQVSGVRLPDERHVLAPALATEWVLLPRSLTTDDLRRVIREMGEGKWKGTTIDVRTMYESASDIIKLESVLNLITLSAVIILFFIILIGVVNTLRMSIRERTREIGTLRAIGMQKADVRRIFVSETFFLSLFACLAGTVLAMGVMAGLSTIRFDIGNNPFFDMLLINGRLHFQPSFMGIVGNVSFILAMALVTAYVPARRAANLPPSKALGHYE